MSSLVDEQGDHAFPRNFPVEREIAEGQDLILVGQEERLELADHQPVTEVVSKHHLYDVVKRSQPFFGGL
jgi:hypothetical protein